MGGVAEAYGSRTHPRALRRPRSRFEDGEAHRDPYTSMSRGVARSLTVPPSRRPRQPITASSLLVRWSLPHAPVVIQSPIWPAIHQD